MLQEKYIKQLNLQVFLANYMSLLYIVIVFKVWYYIEKVIYLVVFGKLRNNKILHFLGPLVVG